MSSPLGQPGIEARTKTSFLLTASLAATVVLIMFILGKAKSFYDYRHFNPDGINYLFFLILLAFTLYWWFSYFDRQPKLKINEQGIWKRRNIFPFAPLHCIPWKEIVYYQLQQKPQKLTSPEILVIKTKQDQKEVQIGLTLLDVPATQLTELIRYYAIIYKFKEIA